ncbi:GDPmannose 4,6-dehydratase [Cryobacterium mesophilum]|uniref:GDP-mannose 4,6-dehydratase n=1 Tax=Terrimesophilobacter mesophilus TaxID=433647 RepID=A0A4R8VC97_9MICO|nr:GDP-mannose 4,6-dehydratase [Terrimesophilobacter mesophilus]MBB5632646.1 GDPmannose 4,6-dehydratase [Terrimesophilobacter mesophilus]TFB79457.1 GDP-mannose 4,6-dehydratase [Terrimesophilobacter mesophilus]
MPVAFITGVTGQDGTYLARALLEEGIDVHGLVRPGSTAPVEAGVTVHVADVRDAKSLTGIIAELQPQVLYHLAGQTSVGASWNGVLDTVQNTGEPVATILAALASSSPDTRLINASSAEIFGLAGAPQDESTPVSPVSPYGAAKALGHFLVAGFRARGLHASSVILYNHESPLRSERFVTGKIAASVARIHAGRQEELLLGDLSSERDWGWAPDYVDAMRLAARQDQPQDFVIGTGVSHSIRDFVVAAFAEIGVDDWEALVRTDTSLLRPADPATQRANNTKAREVLGWAPTMQFQEIVAAMVRHHLATLNRSS